jgi:hypothetical protein
MVQWETAEGLLSEFPQAICRLFHIPYEQGVILVLVSGE